MGEMMKVIDAREKWNKKRRNKVFEDVLQSLGGECHEDVVLPPSIMNLLPKETKEKKSERKERQEKQEVRGSWLQPRVSPTVQIGRSIGEYTRHMSFCTYIYIVDDSSLTT